VLFDFIEEMHEKGEPLERALPDAGIERIRPVMITVAATILALFPLASKGARFGSPCAMRRSATGRRYFHHLAVGPGLLLDFVLDLSGSNGKRQRTDSGSLSRANNT